MEYKVLESDKLEWLVEQVNDHINDGWLPQGGIAMGFNTYLNEDAAYNPDITWAQAMIRDDDNADDNDDEDADGDRVGYGSSPSGNREPRW